MDQQFDLVVIGTGVAGSTVAKQCRTAGWEVAIIDSRPFGGTCALRGCNPKKVLVEMAELVDWNRRMEGRGISGQQVHIDWQAMTRFQKTFTEPIPAKREQEYMEAGIAMFHGPACFAGENAVQVGGDRLSGRYILVATGATPATLGIPGEEHLTTSDQFLELETLPARIVFVGGGYISLESAHTCVRAGVQVQILHEKAQLLENFDPDLVACLTRATREAGIDVHLNTAVKGIEKSGCLVVHTSSDGRKQTFEADLVVHGASRMPNTAGLELEKAGVKYEKKGITVNEYLQSVSNPAVYAAGDVVDTPGAQLTPVAAMDAHVVARNLLEGNHHKPDYSLVPSVVFTVPRLSMVGLLEEAALEQGFKFETCYQDASDWNSPRQVGIKHSAFKLLLEAGSRRILGAHLLGHHAEEVINVFAIAMRAGLSADDIQQTLYGYPTGASDIIKML
ncbi:MAG: NAD(P)/FAD-dependent oxidoreductase [Gemmatimonadaceae bacterium]|nr:NAD(P)/FAD-dependent oxidoreductase [Gloeobacterales cyanobacterium ES-bin-141]